MDAVRAAVRPNTKLIPAETIARTSLLAGLWRGHGFCRRRRSRHAEQVCRNLKIITSAASLGHDESLVVHVGGSDRGGSDRYPPNFQIFGHLRLSIGLEDAEDLIADITNALDETFGAN
ncbi:PLP-dependent transferase [Rhizobium giardinii]|uniref:Uncharacterized protein n=1 Tax=Rhizobium giardinii TaxID=56731 RepID=A0A7W8UB26_9HYPH|nr:PLP-dependent transferase [Rhizobium giardinii]MBB5536038.1 hypothetical protein [Rhizobium giardinii]